MMNKKFFLIFIFFIGALFHKDIVSADLEFDAIIVMRSGTEFKGRMYSTSSQYPDSLIGLYKKHTFQISLLRVKEIEFIARKENVMGTSKPVGYYDVVVTTFMDGTKYKLEKAQWNINEYIDILPARIFFRWKEVKSIKLWVTLRKCPKDLQLMSDEWNVCPYDGTKLPKLEKKEKLKPTDQP